MGEQHLIDEIMKLKYPAWVTGMTGDEFHEARIATKGKRLRLIKTLTGLTKAELRTASQLLIVSRFHCEFGIIAYNKESKNRQTIRPSLKQCQRLEMKGYLTRGEKFFSVGDLFEKISPRYYWLLDARLIKWREVIDHWGWYK